MIPQFDNTVCRAFTCGSITPSKKGKLLQIMALYSILLTTYYHTYGSPFRQFVADSSITSDDFGANVINEIYMDGVENKKSILLELIMDKVKSTRK